MSKSTRRLLMIAGLSVTALAPTPPAMASGVRDNDVYELQVAGTGGVPEDAAAAALQVTVTNTSGNGFVTAYPCGTKRPTASNVNFAPGQTRSNLTVVKLDSKGRVCLYALRAADLIVDVSGWLGSGSQWTATAPARVLDTRPSGGGIGLAAGKVVKVPVATTQGIPSGVRAAALNVTAVDAVNPGYLTVFPCSTPQPTTSNVNFYPGQVIPNLTFAPVQNGETCVYSSADVNVVVDVLGWTSTSSVFTGGVPERVVDTRLGVGGGRLNAGTMRRVHVGPAGSTGAAVVNVTAANSAGPGFMTVYPCGVSRPLTSNVNVTTPAAASSLAIAAPDANGDICVYASMETDLVVDVQGWLESGSGYQAVTPARLTDTRQQPSNTGAEGLPAVPSNVNPSEWLATGERIPDSTAWEPSGNFRTFCGFSHMSYDDPIVYPGQRSAAHLHQFFGNTATDFASTYESLRSSGSGTCQGGPLNRTGYWVPAMFNGSGRVVIPDFFELYYKGNGSRAMIESIQNFPNGLRMIAGYDMNNPGAPSYTWATWSCDGGAESTTIPACGAGGKLRVTLRFPMCWDGRSLDSGDHRSHMAYGTGGGGWTTAQGGCPSSHPIHLPELTLFADYTSDGNTQNWYLSSDRMPGMTHANGSTFHSDWFGAWDPVIQETWTQKCIREMRTCVWGELGDGTRLIDYRGTYNGPRVVDPPSR